jgi:hypothetical protein
LFCDSRRRINGLAANRPQTAHRGWIWIESGHSPATRYRSLSEGAAEQSQSGHPQHGRPR